MREHAYRAYHKTLKKMYRVAGIHHIAPLDFLYSEPERPLTEEIQQVLLADELPACQKVFWTPIGDVELSESIDMKDKHDTQVFMGDIVWFGKYDPNTGKKITYVIDYQSFCYGIVPRETYVDLEYCGGAFEMLRYQYPVKMEIIGNIWEMERKAHEQRHID